MPITSIDIEQATTSTPFFIACSIKSSKDDIFLFFITSLISLLPIPIICILESLSFLLPLGIIIPKAVSIKFFLTEIFSCFLKMFNPQKVKNIVTFLPIEAAPLAIIKDAIALSKSPLKTTIVLLSLGS
ncbi:hypothetical protein SDC9_200993 [bioreactor metagenome]|uniref:Uncharacterized protein n=1 Tax=bioreactor metagenome TaxID=1076179 RepID=A0A645ISG3_9ZZZZ